MNDQAIRQAMARAINGLKMVLGRGRVTLTDDSKKPIQSIQAKLSANETMDILRMAEFGFTSWIPKDGDIAAIFINAERTWGIAVASNHQKYRFQLQNEGESALYDMFGKSILMGKDGIVIEAGNKPIIINNAKGATVHFTDDVNLDMGGKKLTITNPGEVHLAGAGGRKVVCDGDPVSGGVVHADGTQTVYGK